MPHSRLESTLLIGLFVISCTQALHAAPFSRAVRVTEATNALTGFTVRGTITNGFSQAQGASCTSSSFLLVGNGKVYQGAGQCDSSIIAPGATVGFSIVFPMVAPGTYHLRFERSHDPKYRYEMAPVPLNLVPAKPSASTLRQ